MRLIFQPEEMNQIRRLANGLNGMNVSASAWSTSAGADSSTGVAIRTGCVITASGTSFASSSDPCPPQRLLLSSEWCWWQGGAVGALSESTKHEAPHCRWIKRIATRIVEKIFIALSCASANHGFVQHGWMALFSYRRECAFFLFGFVKNLRFCHRPIGPIAGTFRIDARTRH
jgi:hypothetical protein